MGAGQQWLLPPARPLLERVGRQFFRQVPAQPGVYVMRDASGAVVYVGKAKNLRQRLRRYRVANAERVPRRQLRLMREAVRIDLTFAGGEPAALVREAKLLRELRPKFNRAGVWPGKAQFLTWRFAGQVAQFSVQEIPPLGWERFGPMGSYARWLLGSVVRLLWLALNPQAGFSRLPHGGAQNRFALPVALAYGAREAEIRRALANLFWEQHEEFSTWMLGTTKTDQPMFQRAAMQADMEEIEDFVARFREGQAAGRQLALL